MENKIGFFETMKNGVVEKSFARIIAGVIILAAIIFVGSLVWNMPEGVGAASALFGTMATVALTFYGLNKYKKDDK